MKKNLRSLLLTLFAIILTSVNAFSQTNTSTSLSSNPNPSCLFQEVTFVSDVFSSGPLDDPNNCGTVHFLEGATTLATISLLGHRAIFKTSSLDVGSHIITAVYHPAGCDYNGSTSAPRTLIVNPDNAPPTIACPGTQTLALGAGCTASLPDYRSLATTGDDCTPTASITVTQSPAPGTSVSGAGPLIVTLTARDLSGKNSTPCTFTVNKVDNTPLTIACPVTGNTDRNTNAGVCTYTAVLTEFDATATGNCTVSLIYLLSGATTGTGITTLAGKVFNKGVTTVTWTAINGVTATQCSFTVTVADNQQPVITCPPVGVNADRNTNAGLCTYRAVLTEFNATATDNCAGTSLTYSLSGATTGTGTTLAGRAFNKGVTTVTWTATDGVTTAVTCSFTVTVADNQQPVITCPVAASVSRNTNPGVCTYTASGTEFDARATDNCAVTSLTYILTGVTTGTGTSLAGVIFNKGVTTVTWTANDGVTAQITCSFNVVVSDILRPEITCPVAGNTNRNTNAGVCKYTAILTEFDAIATDNCAVTSLTYILTGATTGTGTSLAGVIFNKGVTTVAWTASDGVNPSVPCNFTVTVKDNEQPVITCAVAVNADRNADAGACTYKAILAEFNATATDNCAVTSLIYSLSGATTGSGTTLAGKVFKKGVTTVTWTATDGVTAAITCSFTVTVADNQQPVINCPVAVNADRNADAGVCTYTTVLAEFDATATDNCAVTSLTYTLIGATTGTGTSLAGVVFNKGVTTVTWTATDGVTTAVTCNFTVTVKDNQQPVIVCPVAGNADRNADAGACTYAAVLAEFDATATDNCAVTSLAYSLSGATIGTGSSLAGKAFNKGVTTVTWTATDGVTAAVTCSFTVTVKDNQQPVISCPAAVNADRNANAGVCTYTAVLTEFDATATNNCAVTSLTYTLTGATTGTGTTLAGKVFNKGVTTITWTATDGVTAAVTCSFTVTVKDNQQPVITALTVNPTCLWPPNHKMTDITVIPVITDNCGGTLTWAITSVTSNEPVNGTGDGNTGPDWIFSGHSLQLRAEREGTGTGRIYTITVTATDAAGNTSAKTVTVCVAHNIASPGNGNAFKVGSTVNFSGTFWDIAGKAHTAKWSIDGTLINGTVVETAGTKNGNVTGSYKFTAPGIYKLKMNITDQNGVTSYANTNGDVEAIVVVYDPNGGYTYGSGSFVSSPGAMPSNSSFTGRVNYGFQSNYYKGAANPKGETQFDFRAGDLEFNALNFDYLVVNGAKAQFKGLGKMTTGLVEQSGIAFILTAIDGQLAGGGGVDKIRMKIYNKGTGQVYYDNQPGASDANDPVTPVDNGSSIAIVNSTAISTTQARIVLTQEVEKPGPLNVSVSPNPTSYYFNLRLKSTSNKKVKITVVDIAGRVIEQRIDVPANSTLQLGNRYHPGIYIAEILQGKEKVVLRLIKGGN
jgi:Secretion system C-terminal sorting domain